MILGHPDFSVQPAGTPPEADSLFVHFHEGHMLMRRLSEETVDFALWKDVQPFLPADFEPFELSRVGSRLILSPHPHAGTGIEVGNELEYVDFNLFRSQSFEMGGLMCACRHLWSWYGSNRFCGRCGAPLVPDCAERALRCSACGNLIFPTIAPAVIVAITCGDRILLARNVRYQHYALIAGYVEVGETLEHALRREVLEEVGLNIHSIRYLGDQPWGVSGSHMFAFHAQADDQQPLSIQRSELKDARWFDRADVQPIAHKVSIAYELMERFRNGTL